MQLPGLHLEAIEPTRKVRKDTELQQQLLKDTKHIEQQATKWVREVARTALDDILSAGNPPTYISEVDGQVSGSGAAMRGRGFRSGSIDQANTAVRVTFTAGELAEAANRLKPILEAVILETFPGSRTKLLSRGWSWWVSKDGLLNKNEPAVRVGATVPSSITMYDVLWLVPDANAPANYAWIANRNTMKGEGGRQYNFRKRKKDGVIAVRTRKRGYLAEATHRMRGFRRNDYRNAGITIQGWFVARFLTGPAARTRSGKGEPWRRGVPIVRVAFRRGLALSLGV